MGRSIGNHSWCGSQEHLDANKVDVRRIRRQQSQNLNRGKKWRAQGDDFRTVLRDFPVRLTQVGLYAGLNLQFDPEPNGNANPRAFQEASRRCTLTHPRFSRSFQAPQRIARAGVQPTAHQQPDHAPADATWELEIAVVVNAAAPSRN